MLTGIQRIYANEKKTKLVDDGSGVRADPPPTIIGPPSRSMAEEPTLTVPSSPTIISLNEEFDHNEARNHPDSRQWEKGRY